MTALFVHAINPSRLDGIREAEACVVLHDVGLQPIIERLLDEPDVATVHVRTLTPQCFLYAVRSQG